MAFFALLLAQPALAKKPEKPAERGTTYNAAPQIGSVGADGKTEEKQAKRGKPLVEYTLSPEFKVVLQADLDAKLGKRMAMHRAQPLVEGTPLYGSPAWPGLYCDLMRNRGLGSSAICLRDNDADNSFDDVVRLDFNSGRGDKVFLTDKGKVRGGYFKREQALENGLAYTQVAAEDMPKGRISLLWDYNIFDRKNENSPIILDLFLGDGSNFTGTEILSETYLRVLYTGEPVTVEFEGLELEILGLTEERHLRYRLKMLSENVRANFVFRGYTFNIIMY